MVKNERTSTKVVKVGKDLSVFFDDTNRMKRNGFAHGMRVKVKWSKKDGNPIFTINPVGKNETSTIRVNDKSDRRYLIFEIPESVKAVERQEIELTWAKSRILGEILPLTISQQWATELNDVLSRIDFSKSSNTKFKTKPKGSKFAVNQIIADILDDSVNRQELYIVGTGSKVHNLRKQLVQLNPIVPHLIGVGIFPGDEWSQDLLDSYSRDESLLGHYSAGVIFIAKVGDKFQIVSMGSRGRKVPFLNAKKLYPEANFFEISLETNLDVERTNYLLEAASRLLPETKSLEGLSGKEVVEELKQLIEIMESEIYEDGGDE